MLEGLRLIDWSAYSHAYGAADDVPDLIAALVSEDPKDWVSALDGLYWTVYHHGSVYDSTAVAVPFLIELLGDLKVKCRGRIMELLGHIATGQSCLELNAAAAWADDDGEEESELDDDEESRQQLEEERRWVAAAREAVWQGWPVYLEMGADLDKRVRICSPYLLGQLATLPLEEMPAVEGAPGHAVDVIPAAFVRRLEDEPNELVEASLIFGLEAWLPHAPEHEAVIRQRADNSSSLPAPRLAAALCVCSLPQGATSEAVGRLLDALEQIDDCSSWFESEEPSVEDRHNPLLQAYSAAGMPLGEVADDDYDGEDIGADEDFALPWLEEGLLQEILDRLSSIELPAPPRLKLLLMQQLRRANQFTLETYAEAVRRFLLNEQPLDCSAPREQLTAEQLELIEVLYDDASYWATNVGNVELAFDAMGLPYCRETMARWLGVAAETTSQQEASRLLDQVVDAELSIWALSDDEGLDQDSCEHIDTLVLANIGSDAFMPLLSRFPCLQTLEIGPYTTDAGLAQLPSLPLIDLTLDSRITDVGAAQLTRFPTLRSLNTFGAQLTDRALETIGQLTRLESLYLSGELTLAGLHALLPMKSLCELCLPRMPLSVAVIPILQQLPALNSLSLYGHPLSAEDRRRLKLELPACQIWFNRE